jgi:hypothetical protein
LDGQKRSLGENTLRVGLVKVLFCHITQINIGDISFPTGTCFGDVKEIPKPWDIYQTLYLGCAAAQNWHLLLVTWLAGCFAFIAKNERISFYISSWTLTRLSHENC